VRKDTRTPLPVIRAPIVGDDDGREGDGTAGTEQHTLSAGKKPTSLCAGLLLVLFLSGIGVAIYYAHCIKKETSRLCTKLMEFYA
jgi:hypothetical protein